MLGSTRDGPYGADGEFVRRFTQGLVGVLAGVLLAACTESAKPSPPAPDAVFQDVMDTNAAGWRTEFAVEGATVEDAPTLAILTAKTACTDLENQRVEDVLATLVSGVLSPPTAGSVLYAATVAYCPTYTQAVQDFADANR